MSTSFQVDSMKRIYDWNAHPAIRNYTVADIKSLKGKRRLVQTTANTANAGIDLIMGNAHNTRAVRKGALELFFTAAIGLPDFPTENDILKAAFIAMKDGADSIYTARGPHIVEMLAKENIPVMCHLGLVPRRSTWNGGLRAIGKTSNEAIALWKEFQSMEDAGAFSVEAEVIVNEVMREITKRTKLITCSLGSGPYGDVIYLFQKDICGEEEYDPRHARAFGQLYKIYAQEKSQRWDALKAFKSAVHDCQYPAPGELDSIDESKLIDFVNTL